MNPFPTLSARSPKARTQGAFTLVELLVVITIIGILAGIAIPAIGTVIRNSKATTLKIAVTGMDQGVESYALEYGSYPPDMSSWTVALRHVRKAFPRISNVNLTLLYNLCHRDNSGGIGAITPSPNPSGLIFNASAINRGEALVLFLGGLSDDATSPFTGQGGPFELLPGVASTANFADPRNYQYNISRTNSFIEFEDSKLSLAEVTPGQPVISDDEQAYIDAGFPDAIDQIPTYQPSGKAPVLYFASATYGQTAGTGLFNGYWHPEFGGVRPYKAPAGRQAIGSPNSTLSAAVDSWKWAADDRFQIIAAGSDDQFGNTIWAPLANTQTPAGESSADSPAYFVAKTGEVAQVTALSGGFTVAVTPNIRAYQESGAVNGAEENSHYDNITNFTEQATLFDDLED